MREGCEEDDVEGARGRREVFLVGDGAGAWDVGMDASAGAGIDAVGGVEGVVVGMAEVAEEGAVALDGTI